MALVTFLYDNMHHMPDVVLTSQLSYYTTIHQLNTPNAARTGSQLLTCGAGKKQGMSRTREQPAYALNIYESLKETRNRDFACAVSNVRPAAPTLEVRAEQTEAPQGLRPTW